MLEASKILKDFYSVFIPEELRLKREVQALKENPKQTSPTMKKAKTITPKTKYELLNEENPHRTPSQTLLFIKKEIRDGVEHIIHNGASSEGVLDILIHRTTCQLDELKKQKGKGIKAKQKKLDNAIKQLGWARDNIVEALADKEEEE